MYVFHLVTVGPEKIGSVSEGTSIQLTDVN